MVSGYVLKLTRVLTLLLFVRLSLVHGATANTKVMKERIYRPPVYGAMHYGVNDPNIG